MFTVQFDNVFDKIGCSVPTTRNELYHFTVV